MKVEDVLEVYDREYARTYDERFLLAPHARAAFEREVAMIGGMLDRGGRWLDVACGTGRLLARFPGVARAGLDLSPAMLERARAANPDALFLREGDFRDPVPEWEGTFSLVTCMWYAYGLVESIADVEAVVGNVARWTSTGGIAFVPVWDPRNLSRRIRIPHLLRDRFYGGSVAITGLTWTWIEESGKRHSNMIAPHPEHMREMFREHFADVSLVSYPLAKGWRAPKRIAIRASGKLRDADRSR
jgi:SAM-dependent methyltransferase